MKKRITRLGTLALAALCAIGFTFGCAKAPSPLETVEAAFEKSLDAVDSVTAPKLSENGGSIEYKFNIGSLLSSILGYELDIGFSAKTYTKAQESSALKLDLLLSDTSVADAMVYVDGEEAVIVSDELLGDTAYGVGFDAFMDNLAASEFASGGAFDLGIDLAPITQYQEWWLKNSETIDALSNDFSALWDEIKADIYDLVEARSEITMAKGELTVDDLTMNTTDVNFAYTGETFIETLSEILTLVRDHESVRTFIDTYDEFFVDCLNRLDAPLEIADANTLYADYVEAVDQLMDSMSDPNEEFLAAELNAVVHISKENGEAVGFDFNVKSGDEVDMSVSIIAGPTIADLETMRMSISGIPEDVAAEEGLGSTVEYAVDVIENSDKLYQMALTMTSASENMMEGSVTWDKVSGDYDIAYEIEGEKLELHGYMEVTDEYQKQVLTSITAGGLTIDLGELSCIVRFSDEMPVIDEYTDILTMSAEELTALVNEVAASAQNILLTLVS